MRLLVTGAGGFLGAKLVRELIDRGKLDSEKLTHLTLADRSPVAILAPKAIEVVNAPGDLSDPAYVARLASGHYDSIFHLAAGLTLEVERDPVGHFASSVEALRMLIETAHGRPRFVYTSSLAVFGGELPTRVGDDHPHEPGTAYGAHKAIAEILIADASRRGRIDGRILRLPIVVIRPRPRAGSSGGISDRVAAILREPLEGRDVDVPLSGDTRVPLASAMSTVAALLRLHDAPESDLPRRRALNLPSLTLTVDEIVRAVQTHGKNRRLGKINRKPDATVQAVVAGWPTFLDSKAAPRIGIEPDESLAALISDHLDHQSEEVGA